MDSKKVTSQFEDKGFSLVYRDTGPTEAPTLVFVHAMSFHQDIWQGVLSRLPDGLRIVSYDQRGHGESDVPDLASSLDDYADDAIQLLDHLEIQSCHLVGISFGGLVAQRVAELRPDLVEWLVLSNTAMKIGVLEDWMEGATAARTEGFYRKKIEDSFRHLFSANFCQSSSRFEELVARRLRLSVEGYVGCCQAIGHADLSQTASRPAQPALVIGSDNDVVTPREVVEELAASLPNSEFHLIRGAGHLPCVDKPEEFAGLLVSFLDL